MKHNTIMDKTRLSYLLKRQLEERLTEEENKELQSLLKDETNAPLITGILEEMIASADPEHVEDIQLNRIFDNVFRWDKNISISPPAKTIHWTRWAAAAILLLVLGSSAYFYFTSNDPDVISRQVIPVENDILPGGDKAILTLADGTQIILDSTTGNLANVGGVTVINLDGRLLYQDGSATNETEPVYHRISTPKGGQYQLTLIDGTKVWLNANSSLRFPTHFPATGRMVQLEGEGYFEVAHKAKNPFSVQANDLTVEVLGTHFNINSYEDEKMIKTTLVEGSVKIKKGGGEKLLIPGQQAVVPIQSDKIVVTDKVDIQEILAWKNGLFIFNSTDIHSIMRQVSRWYNIDVEFKDDIQTRFTGMISRQVKASEVLNMLEQTGAVKLTIQDKKVIVRNNK